MLQCCVLRLSGPYVFPFTPVVAYTPTFYFIEAALCLSSFTFVFSCRTSIDRQYHQYQYWHTEMGIGIEHPALGGLLSGWPGCWLATRLWL
jgi:hypothetical protein